MSGENSSDYLRNIQGVVKTHKLNTINLQYQDFKDKFPFLNISTSDVAVYEYQNAGYVSPRNLVRAQIKQAKLQGCSFIPEVVNDVTRVVHSGGYCMRVTTDKFTEILAKKVLLATGAFTEFRNLLPKGLYLNVGLCPLTVAKVEISESDYRKIRYETSCDLKNHSFITEPSMLPENIKDGGNTLFPLCRYDRNKSVTG